MRRSEQEITEKKEIEKILEQSEIIRIAMVDNGTPYLVAMNFAYENGVIYLHSAKEGRKIDVLRKNNNIAFQCEIGVEIIHNEDSCSCNTRYLSVFGNGKVDLIDETNEKTAAMNAIMTKYTKSSGFAYPEAVLGRTLVIKVEIESMTGKKSGY
ncbi:MAG: pyridoxamine 5'-phosphate oxidase family protein [Saccharofermentanales bacterium]